MYKSTSGGFSGTPYDEPPPPVYAESDGTKITENKATRGLSSPFEGTPGTGDATHAIDVYSNNETMQQSSQINTGGAPAPMIDDDSEDENLDTETIN